MYKYEFTDVYDINKISYQVTLPKLTDGNYIKNVAYYVVGTITIEIYINDLLLDKMIIFPEMRSMICELYKKDDYQQLVTKDDYQQLVTKVKKDDYLNYPCTVIVPLFPGDLESSFKYLIDCPAYIEYKILITVETNVNLKLENICTGKTEQEGKIEIEEINELNDKIIIYI